jgi:hypothetical protein
MNDLFCRTLLANADGKEIIEESHPMKNPKGAGALFIQPHGAYQLMWFLGVYLRHV